MNKFLWICLISLVGTACTTQDLDNATDENNALVLTVNCAAPNSSRAEGKEGESDRNENLIKSLHYFFYHEGKTDENAVFSGIVTMAEITQNEAVIRIPMNENVLNHTIFPRPANSCEVYVIANLPVGTVIPDDTSIESLKQLAVEADFKNTLPQLSFVMVGQGTASIVNRNQVQAASGTIQMNRLASKLTIRVSIEPKSELEWEPDKKSLRVSLRNASSNTTIGGAMGNKFFSYEDRSSNETLQESVEGKNVTRYLFEPFYSYPREWEFRSQDALAFYIVLQWKPKPEGTPRNCYYKVLPNTTQLVKNNWYNIDLNIGVLGTFNPDEEPVVVENLTYQVVDWKNGYSDWQSGKETNADLLDTRYLVVEENKHVVNNQNEWVIPYITSHACTIEDLKVERANFTANTTQVTYDDLTSKAVSGKWITLDANTNTIQLKHVLNNDFSSTTNKEYDFTPYIFTFTLRHADNSDFSEDIEIIQNPALVIDAQFNSSGTVEHGFHWVNGQRGSDADFGGVEGVSGGFATTNRNMYVISTTVLPKGSEYILGDPRSTVKMDPFDTKSSPHITGGTEKKLTNYYPTIDDATVQDMVSPKFRISSSYGVVRKNGGISYEDAKKRCATYQEDGYPAGRWRVPTYGEVKFMIKLSVDQKIPALFSTTNNISYWCGNGQLQGDGSSFTITKDGNAMVRCVYDEWYWEKSDYPRLEDKTKFTWGD